MNKVMIIILVGGLIIGAGICYAQGETAHKEIMIEVESRTIALPENEVSVVPLSAVRVRSTDLRNLNSQYNAEKIEKVYALATIGNTAEVNQVFTNKTRKEEIALGNDVVQVKDIFIIQFELDVSIDMAALLNTYLALPEVLYAKEIIRKK